VVLVSFVEETGRSVRLAVTWTESILVAFSAGGIAVSAESGCQA
jgi:hypothetical protein